MMLDWVQVPHQWTHRGGVAWQFARALGKLKGRNATEADGLWLLTQLHLWALSHVSREAEDMEAELRHAAMIREGLGVRLLGDHLGIRSARMGGVLLAMEEVKAVYATKGGWVVDGLVDRYLPMLERMQAGRERVRSIRSLWSAGWDKGPGRTWVHKATGRSAPGWREAYAALKEGKEAPHEQA